MRAVKINILVFSLLFIVAVSSYCLQVNLKISGSLCYLNLEHINRSLNDWEEWIKKAGPIYNLWTYKEGKVENFHLGIAFEGEFMIFFTPRIGVSLGTGYIYGELADKKTALTIERPTGTFVHVMPVKINAFPLNLSAYYFFPLRKELKLFLKAGMGLAWAKYIERRGTEVSEKKYSYNSSLRASGKGPAFFTSFGFIYESDPNIRFFIEGEAKLAKISGFEGETEEGESGTLFYFEEYDPDLDFWRAKNVILKEDPSGNNFRSVQKTVVDLSGFSLKIGVIIKF